MQSDVPSYQPLDPLAVRAEIDVVTVSDECLTCMPRPYRLARAAAPAQTGRTRRFIPLDPAEQCDSVRIVEKCRRHVRAKLGRPSAERIASWGGGSRP